MNDFIENINEDFDIDFIKHSLSNACEKNDLKMGKIMPILRLILVGGITGPDMFSFMNIVGKTETIKRIKEIL